MPPQIAVPSLPASAPIRPPPPPNNPPTLKDLGNSVYFEHEVLEAYKRPSAGLSIQHVANASIYHHQIANATVERGSDQDLAATIAERLLPLLSEQLGVIVAQSLQGLTNDMTALRADVTKIQADVTKIQADVTKIQTDVAKLQTDVAKLQTDMGKLQTDVGKLQTDMGQVQADVAELNGVRGEFRERLTKTHNMAALRFNETRLTGDDTFEVVYFINGDDPTKEPHNLPALTSQAAFQNLTATERDAYYRGYGGRRNVTVAERVAAIRRTTGTRSESYS